MNRIIFLLLLIFSGNLSLAQIHDGWAQDSAIIRFQGGTIPNYIADTSATPLWQIGRTRKTFFTTDTAGVVAIMTDTTNYYPANADNSFVLKIRRDCNLIIDFWHKFQTDSSRDGGYVEFSFDHGISWQNVKGSCNLDSTGAWDWGTRTSNFYSVLDTLPNGVPAFSGSSSSALYSRFQFDCPPPILKTSSSSCEPSGVDSIYIRFHFLSDSVAYSLAGWMIDSIKIEHDGYPGSVSNIQPNGTLDIYPNPSVDGSFTFPALEEQQNYRIRVFNAIGTEVVNCSYACALKLTGLPGSVYYYSVTNGRNYYSGRLMKE